MGFFDSVYAPCAHCEAPIEYQSKADMVPYMNVYTTEDAPTHILRDVLNSPHHCPKCHKWTVLYDPRFPPDADQPRPEPTPRKVRTPAPGEADGGFGRYWWGTVFKMSDMEVGND